MFVCPQLERNHCANLQIYIHILLSEPTSICESDLPIFWILHKMLQNSLAYLHCCTEMEHTEQRLGAVLHRKSCLESDVSEKNAKLAAVIAATNFSEEKINQIYSQAGIEKKKIILNVIAFQLSLQSTTFSQR